MFWKNFGPFNFRPPKKRFDFFGPSNFRPPPVYYCIYKFQTRLDLVWALGWAEETTSAFASCRISSENWCSVVSGWKEGIITACTLAFVHNTSNKLMSLWLIYYNARLPVWRNKNLAIQDYVLTECRCCWTDVYIWWA